jgi:DNA-binding FadR family transcriptional regulator
MDSSGMSSSGGAIRSRSVAEMVANVLRERIIKNDLTDGDLLPKQEELLAELGVSKPSIQAALRILEAEGLIRVRRGKKGGAVVHRPRVANAASVIEMVLRTRCVPTEDLSAALRNLEPVCAKLCASREDRETTVLPRLQAAQARARDDLDDIVRFTESCRTFHRELVACCGNETVILIIGALEAVWSAHARGWAEEHRTSEDYLPANRSYREQGLADHDHLIRLISRGDGVGAMREAQHHLEWSAPTYRVHHEDMTVPDLLGATLPIGQASDLPN